MAAGSASTTRGELRCGVAGTVGSASYRSIPARRLGFGLLFVAAAAFTAVVLWHFHDRFWWPPDEGAYAHVAERVLAGEVLNRDVQDIHPGYVNLANAAALWMFGRDLLSLRYPMVAVGFASACLIFLLLSPRGGLLALTGAIAFTSLSVVQFLNPTAHWYSLLVLILIIAALSWLPATSRARPAILGFLIVLMILFRQLSGAFVAIGVVAFLLTERRDHGVDADGTAGRTIVAIMAAGLCAYLLARADLVTFVMFGVWPLLVLAWAWVATRAGGRALLDLVGQLALGGVIAAAPLITYHLVHGSLDTWFQDTVLAAVGLTNLSFIDDPSYATLPALGVLGALGSRTPAAWINGVFWLLLVTLPLVLGLSKTRALWRNPGAGPGHPLPFLALFYALVSVHYQIPIYLFYTVGVTLVGVLWMSASWQGTARRAAPALAVSLAASALYFQAAQPLSRGISGMVLGDRIALSSARWRQPASLHVEPGDMALYDRLIATVEEHIAPDATILAIPFNPELYFLTSRKNPFRFGNSALGLRDRDALAAAIAAIAADPPGMVFYRPDDKYNTAASRALIEHIRRHYEPLGQDGGFAIYKLPESGLHDRGQTTRRKIERGSG